MVKTEEPTLNIEAIVAQNELCHDTYICPEQTLREFFAMQVIFLIFQLIAKLVRKRFHR